MKTSYTASLSLRILFCLAFLATALFSSPVVSIQAASKPANPQTTPAPSLSPAQISMATSVPLTPPAPNGPILYQENFDIAPSNWSTGTVDDSLITLDRRVANGAYLWSVLDTRQPSFHFTYYNPPVVLPSTFVFKATSQVASSPAEMGYGLLFRVKDPNNFYYFEVLQSGRFRVLMAVNQKFYIIVSRQVTKDLKPNLPNILEVKAEGSTYRFYINDKLQATARNLTYNGGSIGLGLEIGNQNDTANLSYDNLMVCNADC